MEGISNRHEHQERAQLRIDTRLDPQIILAIERVRQRARFAKPDSVDPIYQGDTLSLAPDRVDPADATVKPEGQADRRRNRLAGVVLQIPLVTDGLGGGSQ